MTDNAADTSKADGGGGNARPPIVLTRSSPYVRNPHGTLERTISDFSGWSGDFRQITYYRPPTELQEMCALAYLVERTLAADNNLQDGGLQSRGQILVADWNFRLAQNVVSFLAGWPGLRGTDVRHLNLPRRSRRAIAPLMIVDGSRPWLESHGFVRLVDRYFGRSARHVIALPGGTFGLGGLSPKQRFLFPQVSSMIRDKNLDGIILLDAFSSEAQNVDGNPEWQRSTSEIRRSFAAMRSAFAGTSIMVAAVITDEAGQPIDIDRNPLVPQ